MLTYECLRDLSHQTKTYGAGRPHQVRKPQKLRRLATHVEADRKRVQMPRNDAREGCWKACKYHTPHGLDE